MEMQTTLAPARERQFRSQSFDFGSFFFTGLTGLATLLILGILATILIYVVAQGWNGLSWRFISTIPEKNFFDPASTGVLPMIVGTTIRVIVMTIFVIPVGVITATYLTEYEQTTALLTRLIRGAVNNLAGVPSIVFGLFGVGFAVLLRRLEARGEPVAVTFLRRLAMLAVFGVIAEVGFGFHILFSYACWGVPLLLVRRWSTRALLLTAVLATAARPLLA